MAKDDERAIDVPGNRQADDQLTEVFEPIMDLWNRVEESDRDKETSSHTNLALKR